MDRRTEKIFPLHPIIFFGGVIGLLIFFALMNAVLGWPVTVSGGGNVYYVSASGNDSNAGTSSSPWRTIQRAASRMHAGDTAVVRQGDYAERVQVTESGEKDARITFRADGRVRMQGFTVHADYITITGFEVTDTENDWRNGWGIFFSGIGCVLADNYVHFATRGGILLHASSSEPTRSIGCTVRDNRLYRNQGVGIDVRGRDHLIAGNEIWGTIQNHPEFSPPWADADGIHFHGSGHRVIGNYIHDITYAAPENVDPHIDCFQTWSGDGKQAARDVVFDRNICVALESLSSRENGHGFMLADSQHITIKNNIILAHGGVNTGSGGNTELTIVNNLFFNDIRFRIDTFPSGISLIDAPNSTILNNIFYDQPAHHIYIEGRSSMGLSIGANLVYRTDGKSPWGERYPEDIWEADPKFLGPERRDFRLSSTSPAIDNGNALPRLVDFDIAGIRRPQGEGYDIGPYEYPAD